MKTNEIRRVRSRRPNGTEFTCHTIALPVSVKDVIEQVSVSRGRMVDKGVMEVPSLGRLFELLLLEERARIKRNNSD